MSLITTPVKVFTVQVPSGYFHEATPLVQKIYAHNTKEQSGPKSWMYQNYKPQAFDEEKEGITWKEWISDEHNQTLAVTHYPHFSYLTVDLSEQEFIEYSSEVSDVKVVSVKNLEVALPGMGEHQLSMQMEFMKQLLELNEKCISQLKTASDEFYNTRVGSLQPGGALFHVNKTMLLEDCCTDRLQDHMDEGWRIIACCPQPDSRRPDYILGRYDHTYNAKSDGFVGAERG